MKTCNINNVFILNVSTTKTNFNNKTMINMNKKPLINTDLTFFFIWNSFFLIYELQLNIKGVQYKNIYYIERLKKLKP